MKTRVISLLMNAAGCLVLASCGEKQGPAANTEAPQPVPDKAVDAGPVPPEPEKPEGPAYHPAVMAELERLKNEYPQIAVNVDAELARLKDYEHAEKIFQSDLPVIAREYSDLLSCSSGGRHVFFDEEFLAERDPKKLVLIKLADNRVQRIVGAMSRIPAALNDRELQAAYDRLVLLEQASRRLTVLKFACFFRQLILMPRFQEAVKIASESGKLIEVRAARRLLDMMEKEEGLLNYSSYKSKQSVEILGSGGGEPSVAKQLDMGTMVLVFDVESKIGEQLRQKLEIYEALKHRFQRGEITVLDVALIGALERAIRHGLKTTELKQAALSMAGVALSPWMPEAWESIWQDGDYPGSPPSEKSKLLRSLEKASGIPFAIYKSSTPAQQERARNPYSMYGEQPKTKLLECETVIYMNQRAYKGSEFTRMLLKHPLRQDILEMVEKGPQARGSYRNDWTLDSVTENGKLKPLPGWSAPSQSDPQPEEEK